MSRCHWLHVFALVGLTLQPIGDWGDAQGATPEKKEERQQVNQPVAPLDLAPINEGLTGIDKRLEALEPKPETADERRRAEGDLEAQAKMAVWAERMTYVTGASAFVSILGIVLLFVTLRQNRRSMKIALMGVRRANASVRVSRQTAERQLRAYLNYFNGRVMNFGKPGAYVRAQVVNRGQTPAYEVRLRQSAVLAPLPLTEPLRHGPEKKLTNAGVLQPGDDFGLTVTVTPDLTEEQAKAVNDGAAAIYFFGEIEYRDAFGQFRWSRYRMMLRGDFKENPAHGLVVCEEGNDAN